MRFTFFLLLLIPLFVQAQDAKVTSGVVAFQSGDYNQAITSLDEALSNPGAISEPNLAKAYFYRAKARYTGFYKEGSGPNATQWADAPLQCYRDLKTVLELDDSKWTSKAQAELGVLRNALLSVGLMALNQANQQTNTAKNTSLDLAQEHLQAALDIEADQMTYDLLGQTALSRGDSTKALALFYQSIESFQSEPPIRPDLLVGYTFYRAALIERYSNQQIDKALALVEQGAAAVEQEQQRNMEIKDSYTATQWAQVDQQYQTAREDLRRFELDILMNNPDKKDEALEKFAKAVEEEPDNYTVLVAYASMMESKDPDKALDLYKKAIQVDPTNTTAYFNAGALEINKAIPLINKANEANDMAASMELQSQAMECYRNALPYFEKAYEIKPDDPQVLQALQQITISIGDTEAYQKYKAAADALRN
jgi:tetratricopeptide (TPR) repeat protein